MPATLYGLVRKVSGVHQIWLAVMSAIVFGIGLAPIEIQRRVVNAAVEGGNATLILWLAAGYLGVGLAEGLTKLVMNIYRGWVAERAVRWLRKTIAATSAGLDPPDDDEEGAAKDRAVAGDRPVPAVERPAGAVLGDGVKSADVVESTNGAKGTKSTKSTGVEISMTVSEAEPIGSFVGSAVSEPSLQGGILLSVFVYMVFLQPLIALVALAVFAPQFVLVPLMQRALNRRIRARIWFIRKMSTSLVDHDGHGEANFDDQNRRVDRVFEINMGVFKIKFTLNFLMNILHYAGIAGILGLGGYLVTQGTTEIGTVVAFVAGLNKIRDPWGDLVDWFRDYRVAAARYRLVASALRNGAPS